MPKLQSKTSVNKCRRVCRHAWRPITCSGWTTPKLKSKTSVKKCQGFCRHTWRSIAGRWWTMPKLQSKMSVKKCRRVCRHTWRSIARSGWTTPKLKSKMSVKKCQGFWLSYTGNLQTDTCRLQCYMPGCTHSALRLAGHVMLFYDWGREQLSFIT